MLDGVTFVLNTFNTEVNPVIGIVLVAELHVPADTVAVRLGRYWFPVAVLTNASKVNVTSVVGAAPEIVSPRVYTFQYSCEKLA